MVKTHRFTQLFLYCSGGESSVKCVRPALEMEASKEEQRGVVRFLVAEGAAMCHKVKTTWNAAQNRRRLAINHGCSAFCEHQRRATFSDPVFVIGRCIRFRNP